MLWVCARVPRRTATQRPTTLPTSQSSPLRLRLRPAQNCDIHPGAPSSMPGNPPEQPLMLPAPRQLCPPVPHAHLPSKTSALPSGWHRSPCTASSRCSSASIHTASRSSSLSTSSAGFSRLFVLIHMLSFSTRSVFSSASTLPHTLIMLYFTDPANCDVGEPGSLSSCIIMWLRSRPHVG